MGDPEIEKIIQWKLCQLGWKRQRELTMKRGFRVPNSITKQQADKMSSASNMWYIHELEKMTQRTEARVQKAEIKMSMIPRL